ncbi:MAG TPA: LysM peptidoglycan-binding domain-containing protein [Steroidobacteraceae bacterium]
MWIAYEIADWWDAQHKASKQALDEFVDEHPNWVGIVVAGTTATAMDLGAGMVDVLRLGQGVQEGGVKGYVKDGLRLLQFAPAIGKAGQSVLARVLVDVPGGVCTWISATKALRQVGVKAFASVDELAVAAGFKSISELGGAFVDAVIPALKKLGARVTNLGHLANFEAVVAAVRGDSPVLFSVEWDMLGQRVGHTLYAFKDALGRIRIADRSGQVVASLAELSSSYPGIGKATVYGPAALVQGATIKIADGIATMAMEVRAMLAVDPETAAQTMEMKKLGRSGALHTVGNVTQLVHDAMRTQAQSAVASRSPLGVAPAANPAGSSLSVTNRHILRVHIVRNGDWLSKLAAHYYGHASKWPILYEANRKIIGSNPNLIIAGQRLIIPKLPRLTARSKHQAR